MTTDRSTGDPSDAQSDSGGDSDPDAASSRHGGDDREQHEPTPSRFHTLKGSIKRFFGWATADRRVEAEGAAEERRQAPPSEGEVQRTEHEVKRDYGETLDAPRDP